MKQAFLYWCAQSLIACREHITMWLEMEQEFTERVTVPKIKFHSTRSRWRRRMPFWLLQESYDWSETSTKRISVCACIRQQLLKSSML